MKEILIKSFVTLALLLSISEAASGGTVSVVKLLNGAASNEMLGEVSHYIGQDNATCTVTVAPAEAYTVQGVYAVKVTDGGNAQSRLKAPVVSIPIEVSAGNEENTWFFSMPSEEYDVEVTVNFTYRAVEYYPLWVMGTQVNNINKDNILGGGTVRFNPATSTLSLYGALLGDVAGTDTIFSTSLPELTVDLHGNNIIKFSTVGFRSRNQTLMASLTFTTDATNPGQLSWQTDGGTFAEGFNITYGEPLALQSTGTLIAKTEVVSYDLMVGSTMVTSVNCTDVLGDGTVKYVDSDQTLVLDHASLNEPIKSSLAEGLTIYLLGKSTISGSGNLITSTVTDAMLTFTTSETAPGSLTLTKTEDESTWIGGFSTPSVPYNYVSATEGNKMSIASLVPISPFVADTEDGELPAAEEQTGAFGSEAQGQEDDTYLNVVINNVLYTLKAGDYNEGSDGNPDDPSGVNLTEVPADMGEVLSQMPGSDAYADAFKGLTIQVPAGNGQIMVTGEIGENALLAVKIGSNAPVLFPNEDYPRTNILETLNVPYSCSEPTYVYIYLAHTGASARSEVPLRGRVLTGHIKVSTVSASSTSVVSNNSYSAQTNTISNRVIAYDIPASAKTADKHGIVLSTVTVFSSPASSRGMRREPEQQQKKITELGSSVFDSLDKDQILYVDVSQTDIKDMTVNRSAGVFQGFPHNTLFHLPADNDDGGEVNVVLGGNCQRLSLSDEIGFRAHKSFTAASALLEREFTASQTATVFLPFNLLKEQADKLGAFHTFKEIQGANAVFNEAESNGTSANKPYILLPSVTKLEVENVEVEGYDSFQAVTGKMVGTYQQMLWESPQTDSYIFAATDSGSGVAGEFVRVTAGASLPPFQAFIMADGVTTDTLNVAVGNVITGIANPHSLLLTPKSEWFNVSGQRLSGAPSAKGLYISNNKKVLVK